jgi:pimeloyl-ACP methyl ester carboxylesterase
VSPWLALAALPVVAALVSRILRLVERRRFPPPGVLVDAGGFKLHFRIEGDGAPTVVLDSALAATSLSWAEIQPRIAELARVVSYDRAGFGWSDPSPEPRRVDCLVSELRRGLKALGLEPPFVLVGHSYGGFVMKLFASRHPEEVAGLALVDVPHPRKWVELDSIERKRIARGARIARAAGLLAHFGIARLVYRFAARSRLESLGGLLANLPARRRAAIRSFWVRPFTLRALSSLIEEAPRSAVLVANAAGDLGDLPLAVLTASHPSPERVRDQEEEARRSRRSWHVVAKHSGHWIPLEDPELVVAAIRDVVSAARSAAGSRVSRGWVETRGAGTTPSGP